MPKTGIATINDVDVWRGMFAEMVDKMKKDGCSYRLIYVIMNSFLDEKYDEEYPDAPVDDD